MVKVVAFFFWDKRDLPPFNDGNPYFMGPYKPRTGLGLIFSHPLLYGNVMGVELIDPIAQTGWGTPWGSIAGAGNLEKNQRWKMYS